jgi:hypothetical protein
VNTSVKKILLSAPYVGKYANRYVRAMKESEQALRKEQQLKQEKQQLAARLATFEGLAATKRLIETEYPYSGSRRNWQSVPSVKKLSDMFSANEHLYRELLRQFATYENKLSAIPLHDQEDDLFSPHWINTWFPGLDAISLYGLLGIHNPRYYVEVGSGTSTKFARRAIRDLGLRTKIFSIDPCPRAEIDNISDTVIRKPLEMVDVPFWGSLTTEDIVFVDSSHRSFPGSDVTVFFTEILASLPKGMLYGMHDIFLPEDYPESWNHRYFNEQYLLACYLLGGADGDEIVFPSRYVSQRPDLMTELDTIFKKPAFASVANHGGMCWMRKR